MTQDQLRSCTCTEKEAKSDAPRPTLRACILGTVLQSTRWCAVRATSLVSARPIADAPMCFMKHVPGEPHPLRGKLVGVEPWSRQEQAAIRYMACLTPD